jgi:hypothetical protein
VRAECRPERHRVFTLEELRPTGVDRHSSVRA